MARGDRGERGPEVDRETDFDAPVPPEVRQSARLVQIVVGVLALVGLGVVAAFGGFERAGIASGTPTAEVNQVVSAGFWDFKVEGAFAGEQLHGHTPRNDGNYLLEVDVKVTNNYTRSYGILDSFQLQDFDGVATGGIMVDDASPRYAYFLRDDRLAAELQPGLPERIALVWEVKAGTPVPKELRLLMFSDIPKVASFQVVNSVIVHHDPAATVVVPVTNRTTSA